MKRFCIYFFSLVNLLLSNSIYLPKPIFEIKLSEILSYPLHHKKLEGSGIYYYNKKYYIIFDNINYLAIIDTDFNKNSLLWLPTRPSSGFEAITFSEQKQSFYILEEASKEIIPHGYIHEYRLSENKFLNPVKIPFPLESKHGFEGIAVYTLENKNYFILLLEKETSHPKIPQKGNLLILEEHPKLGLIEYAFYSLSHIGFKDYSDIAIKQNKVAIVSQKSSAVWIGEWDYKIHKPIHGKAYKFPLVDEKGKFEGGFQKGYCNVEGVSWVSEKTLVFVSDRQKKHKRKEVCAFKEEMLHIFEIP